MTSYEMEFKCSVMSSLKEIARELKRMNRIAAIRIRNEVATKVGPHCMKEIDKVMEDEQ